MGKTEVSLHSFIVDFTKEGDVSPDTTKTLKNSFTILTSVKMATLGLLKIKVFQKKVMVS